MKVLVLDDEPTVVSMVQTAMELIGVEVQTTGTGDAARQAITAQPPDLLILDLKLQQEEDGLSVLRWLRQHHPGVPVVVLTGYNIEDVRPEVDALGVLEILEKPQTAPELQERIQAIAKKLGKAI